MESGMEVVFRERKVMRWGERCYDACGAYFLTICTKEKKCLLSEIVGDGALDVPQPRLTAAGKVLEKYLQSADKMERVTVDHYVIMPNHLHVILFVTEQADGKDGTSGAPSPTNEIVPRFVAVLKRLCNKEIGENVFQRSYHDHIIRDRKDYDEHVKYICENPLRWQFDPLYVLE